MPAELVDAVAFVESAYDPSAIGQAGEIGIMQVMPSTAAMLGFQGNRAQLMKYRAGYGEETMSARSVEYCRRVRDHLAALGSPLATLSIPLPP